MGCGESKHAVADNAVAASHRKNPATIFRDAGGSKKSKDIEAILATGTTTDKAASAATVNHNPARKAETGDATGDSGNKNKNNKAEDGVVIAPVDVKDVKLKDQGVIFSFDKDGSSSSNEKINDNNNNDGGGIVIDEDEERLIARESPSHFFSSREDLIDGVGSEKSVYFSPSHSTKETEKSGDNVGGVDQDQEVDELTVVEETKAVTENGMEAQENKEDAEIEKKVANDKGDGKEISSSPKAPN